jgi:hypothetical protein
MCYATGLLRRVRAGRVAKTMNVPFTCPARHFEKWHPVTSCALALDENADFLRFQPAHGALGLGLDVYSQSRPHDV